MKKNAAILVAGALTMLWLVYSPFVAGAAGADTIQGKGERDTTSFNFTAVITPAGDAHGHFKAVLSGTSISGKITCGSVVGNVGVFGGQMADTEDDFTIMVNDEPDGIIIGTGRPNCDTSGFGDPGTLPITAGTIRVVDR